MYMQQWKEGPTSYFPMQGTRVGDGGGIRTSSCGNYHNATTDTDNRVNILHIHKDHSLFHIFEYQFYFYYVKSVAGPVRCVRDSKWNRVLSFIVFGRKGTFLCLCLKRQANIDDGNSYGGRFMHWFCNAGKVAVAWNAAILPTPKNRGRTYWAAWGTKWIFVTRCAVVNTLL